MDQSTNAPLNSKKLEKWLNGVTLGEKIKTLENGKYMVCLNCNKVFFDKETPEERNKKKCKSSIDNHDCVEDDTNYIILERGFRGIGKVVLYPDSCTAEQALIDYFDSTLIENW